MLQWVKLTNAQGRHFGVTLTEGLNTDPLPWDGTTRGPGGFHFARLQDIHRWLGVCGEGGAAYLWNVKVPPGTPFTDFGNKAKAHSIILSNRRVVPDHVYASCITLRTQEITCGTTTTPSDARRRAASCAPRLRNSQQQHCFVCSGKHLALSNTFLSRTQTRYTTTKTTIQDSARGSAPCTSSSSSSTTEDGSNSPALMIALACSMLS